MAKKKTTKKTPVKSRRPRIGTATKKSAPIKDPEPAERDPLPARRSLSQELQASFQQEYAGLRDHLRFNKEEIDEALIEQPVLFEQVSSHLATAINRRDLSREEQKQVLARVADRVREEAETKLTVAQVEAAVEQDPSYISAREDYKTASYWVDKWDGLKDSYRQRSAAMRDLTQLHVTGHFQVGTRSYGDVRREMADQRR